MSENPSAQPDTDEVRTGPFNPEHGGDRPDAIGPEDVNDDGEVISR